MPLASFRDPLLALQLGQSIHIDGIRRIAFQIRTILLAIEDIVGRNVDDRNRLRSGRFGYVLRT